MSKDKVLQAALDKVVELTKQRDDLLAACEEAIELLKEWNAESTIKAQEVLESAIAAGE